MFRRFINVETRSITGAAILLASTTLLSRFMGIVRDRTFAHLFGAGPIMDSYYAAFRIPDLVYNLLIVGALTAGFIPTFTRLFYQGENKTAAWKLADNIVSIVAISLIALASIGIIGTPVLVKIIAPGFVGEQLKLVTDFSRVMLISPLLLGISMVLGGILQSLRQFFLYSVAPIFYNLGIIIGATVLVNFLGPIGLAWGVVLGALLHLGIQIIGVIHNGYRWRWSWNLKDSNTRLIGRLMVPRTLGLAVNQVNTVIVTALASLLPLGSVAIFNYANNLQDVPAGIIGIPFAIAVFPVLSQLAAENDPKKFGQQIASSSRQILFLILPLAICFLILRAQIVRVVLGTGEFDWTATISTANALAFFSLGILARALIPLYARAFYALNNTKTPFFISIFSEIFCIALSILLMRPLGVSGLALANALAAIVNILLLITFLHRRNTAIIDQSFITLLIKISGAGLIMALIMQLAKYPLANLFDQHYFIGILSQGLIAGILGFLVYGLICWVFKVEEMANLQSSLHRRWLKLRNIGEGIDQAEKL
jgi:putative peptidoglycan lipid II flippase